MAGGASLKRTSVINNQAVGPLVSGGGISFESPSDTLSLSDQSVFSGNKATKSGGGTYTLSLNPNPQTLNPKPCP